MLAGTIVGTAQWGALRYGLGLSPAWIPVTAAAWAIGIWAPIGQSWRGPVGSVTVDSLIDSFIRALVMHGVSIGIAAGIAQSCLLRGRVRWPFAWFPATLIASSLGWKAGVSAAMNLGFVPFWTGGAVLGVVSTGVSAPVLLWMLHHPKLQTPEPQPAEESPAVTQISAPEDQ
jgi:hypothetical protein